VSFVTTQPEALMASAVPSTATALRADVVICTYGFRWCTAGPRHG
jgi:hypothetical protein